MPVVPLTLPASKSAVEGEWLALEGGGQELGMEGAAVGVEGLSGSGQREDSSGILTASIESFEVGTA
jgi:hypothetical protein